MKGKKQKEFEEAVKPLRDWLLKYKDPHSAVLISSKKATLFEGVREIVFLLYGCSGKD